MTDQRPSPYPDLPYPKFRRHFTEFIGVADDGHLWVEDRDCTDLAETFGTPLYVLSENQFRHNLRRFRGAFQALYPNVEILFANKSNNSLAVRHIMNQEGAGGDCFGINELYLSLLAGTDPATLVLNGNNKSQTEIRMAVANGVCINLDAVDEPDIVNETAKALGRPAEVGIRVKLELSALQDIVQPHGSASMADKARNHKWGMPYVQTVELIRRIRDEMPDLRLTEISYHLSRMRNVAADFAEMAREMIQWSARLREDTGWLPPCIDIGGGWAFGRREKTGPHGVDDETTSTFEDYAEAVCTAVHDECAKLSVPLPRLRIEPGRAISACCGVTIGRVGAVKEWPGVRKWVNVDCSTNHVSRIVAGHWYHHIVAVHNADATGSETVDVVGPLCTYDILGEARVLPPLARSDLVALLDTGSYAETTASNYNGEQKPASVLVCGDNAEVSTERERSQDVIGRYRVPSRLLQRSFGRA